MKELREERVESRERLRCGFRGPQLRDGAGQGQDSSQIWLGWLEPFELSLPVVENRLNHGRPFLIESGQEVVCQVPRCEIRHEEQQVLREFIREGWVVPPAVSKPFG